MTHPDTTPDAITPAIWALVIAEPMTGAPQGGRHRVLCRDARSIAQDGHPAIDRGVCRPGCGQGAPSLRSSGAAPG